MEIIITTGAERSGTSMTNRWIGENPNIFLKGEYRFVETAVVALNFIKQQKRGGRISDGQYEKSKQELRNFLLNMYKHEGWDGKKIIADKHPCSEKFNKDMLVTIKELFPEVKFVYMLRDGYDVVKSCCQKEWDRKEKRKLSPDECCKKWNTVINTTYEWAKKNALIVRYEDMAKAETKEKVSEYLGIKLNDFEFTKGRYKDGSMKEDFFSYFNDNDALRIREKIEKNINKTGYGH